MDITEAWIDGLAAGPSFPSWAQYVVLEQQKQQEKVLLAQQRQQKKASVVAPQQHESRAAAGEVAGLRDLLLDALKGDPSDPCDHDQQVDILLHKLAQQEQMEFS